MTRQELWQDASSHFIATKCVLPRPARVRIVSMCSAWRASTSTICMMMKWSERTHPHSRCSAKYATARPCFPLVSIAGVSQDKHSMSYFVDDPQTHIYHSMHELDALSASCYHVVCLTCKHINHLPKRPQFLHNIFPNFVMFCQVCDKHQVFACKYMCAAPGRCS